MYHYSFSSQFQDEAFVMLIQRLSILLSSSTTEHYMSPRAVHRLRPRVHSVFQVIYHTDD